MAWRESLAGKKHWLLWGAVLVVAVLVLKATLLAPPRVRVVPLVKRDLNAEVYGNGTVEAKVVVGVSTKITGRIVELHADQGDRVRAGQLLARLEDDDLLRQEQLADANLSRAGAGLRVEEANLRKAEAGLLLAERNARRFQSLVEDKLVSRLEAEQYDTVWQIARAEVARSRAAIDALRMEERASRAALGLARSKVAETVIQAPQDGIIVSRDLEQGATVTPGQAIYTLADPRTVWVRANVDEALLPGVAVGKAATITLRSATGEGFPGQVARLARQSDRVTEELQVDVAFSSPRDEFRLGEQAEVLIVTAAKRAVPALPSGALTKRGTERGVWTVAQGRLAFRPVTVGIEDRRALTEIVAGLADGEGAVLAPPAQLAAFKDGMKVRTTP